MSEGRVRLRLAGEPEALALPVREGEARAALPSPSIAIVAAVRAADAERFAAQVAEAARAAGRGVVELRAALRAKPGAEAADGLLRASPDAMPEALDAQVAASAGEDLWVVTGAPFVALRRAGVSVLITSGASSVQWDPQLRALRDRFELVIAEPRPGLARALIERLTLRGSAAT